MESNALKRDYKRVPVGHNRKWFESHQMTTESEIFEIRIWTIDDVARFLKLAKGTIYNLTSRREIPFRKRGKKLYFLPSEIMNWIEES